MIPPPNPFFFPWSAGHTVTNTPSSQTETAFTALGYAIRNGEVRTVREILEGDEFNQQLLKRADYAGNSALHLAAVGPEPLILRDLLTRGASVHARNRANNTPLYLAEKTGNAECVRLLKEAGAHLWLDNELKGEGSRVPSRGASRGVSPAPSAPRSVDGCGVGGGGKAEVGGVHAGSLGDGGGGVVGEGLAQAEAVRALLTGDKGKIVG